MSLNKLLIKICTCFGENPYLALFGAELSSVGMIQK
jgi:hypothetical protein